MDDNDEEQIETSRRQRDAESNRTMRGALSSKRSLDGGVYGGTPPKRQRPDRTSFSAYTHAENSAKHSEYKRRHFHSETENLEEGAPCAGATLDTKDVDEINDANQRKNLFNSDKK